MSNEVILQAIEGTHAGQNFVFDENGTYLIGRSKYSALKIPNAKDMKVSRIHMLLILDSHSVRVRDLGSRNGTTVNGIELLPAELAEHPEKMNPLDKILKSDDIISIGDSVWKVKIIAKEDFEEDATMPIEKLEIKKEELNIKKTLPPISTNSEKSLSTPIQINKEPLTFVKPNPKGGITQVKPLGESQQNAPTAKVLPKKDEESVQLPKKASLPIPVKEEHVDTIALSPKESVVPTQKSPPKPSIKKDELNIKEPPIEPKLKLLDKSIAKPKLKEKSNKIEEIKDINSPTAVMKSSEMNPVIQNTKKTLPKPVLVDAAVAKVKEETKGSQGAKVTTLSKDSKLQLLEKTKKAKEEDNKSKVIDIEDSKNATIKMASEEFDNLDDLVFKIDTKDKKRVTNFTVKKAK